MNRFDLHRKGAEARMMRRRVLYNGVQESKAASPLPDGRGSARTTERAVAEDGGAYARHGGRSRWPALLAVPLIAALTMLMLTWDAPARQTPSEEARAPESQPATAPAETEPARRSPTAEDVVKALQGIAPAGRPVIPPALPAGLERQAGGDEGAEAHVIRRSGRLLPEGYRIARRPGRLVEAEGWGWAVAFEERGRGAVDRPVRLLPNRFLEQMEAASEAGTQAVVFEISGTVTEYRGENYLLVDFLMIRPNLGNLK